MNIFRNQHAVLANEENDGVVRNYFLQADSDSAGVDAVPLLPPERFPALSGRRRPPIGPFRSQSVEVVHSRKDSRPDGYGLALQAVGISAAVPLFVVGAHDRNNRVREFNSSQNIRTDNRMNFHFLELFRSKTSWLGENVFGDRELANVVQHGGGANGIQLGFIQPKVLGNLDRINLHPAQMIVGGVILRFNREGKRLDGAQMKRSNFLGVFLLGSETAQVSLIGAVDPINDGEG